MLKYDIVVIGGGPAGLAAAAEAKAAAVEAAGHGARVWGSAGLLPWLIRPAGPGVLVGHDPVRSV